MTQDEGDAMAAADGDYHQRDLYDSIKRCDFPSWTLKMQIMPFEDAKTYRFNPFDLTKVCPHGDYPLVEVGRLILDRNVSDYYRPDYWHADGDLVRTAYTLRADDDDWGQPGTLVREVLDDAARERLVSNIAGHLLEGVTEPVLQRAFQYWRNVDKSLGHRVEQAVRAGQG